MLIAPLCQLFLRPRQLLILVVQQQRLVHERQLSHNDNDTLPLYNNTLKLSG